MKSRTLFQNERIGWHWAALFGLWVAVSTPWAAETNAPAGAVTNALPAAATNTPPSSVTNAPSATDTNAPQETVAAPMTPEQMFEGGTNAYNNWIEFGVGGFLRSGNQAQFQRRNQTSGGAFGGIEDFHYQNTIAKGTTMNVDGRAIFDNEDYKLSLGVEKEKLGYLRFSATQYRTWYDGDGGFFPPTGAYYPLGEDALALDRGDISFEAGLTLDKLPQVKFRYDHLYRDGEKGSTSWGYTHPVGGTLVRGLSPSIYDIDERSDVFQLDVTHHIKATEFGAGLRYESGRLDDALKINQFPGESFQQKITDRQGTSYDLFNVHSFTESWINKNVLLSSGFSYSDLDNTFSGSRNYGSDYDVLYRPYAQNGVGYFDLSGGSHLNEYVGDLNLFTKPWKHFTIVPSLRIQAQDTDADSSGFETMGAFSPAPFTANSGRSDLDVRERLDLTYNGITNWVLYARGELTEGSGNLAENGGLGPINQIGVPSIQRYTDDDRFFQKYSAGARWYPARRLTVDAGGYYKHNDYNYDHTLDSTPNDSASPNRYPAYLAFQNFETYDGNIRLTLRPRQNVTAVTRYDYQYSTIQTRPAPISDLNETESSRTTSHIFAQDVSWTPWSRLYLQAGFNYVLNETQTPTSDYSPAVLPAQNNYWTLNISPGLVLDDRTDLKVSFFYYQADNYQDNSLYGVPYGAGEEEYAITATVTRRINRHLRVALKYGYSHYKDQLYGGHRDFDAQLVYASMQYRF
jgi:hypothetical protein